jgi:peptide/nickel transport system substrate-binding protein
VYDPTQGRALLDEAGWKDHDQNPNTPRQATGVPDVPDGTALSVELLIDETPYHQDLAAIIQDSLETCGVALNVSVMPSQTLYAPGPDGPIFGRKFDLTLLSWQGSAALDCRLYHSQRMPSQENQWIGTNVAGLRDENYDAACISAELALPEALGDALRVAEQSFLAALPSVPIFAPIQVMVLSASECSWKSVNSELAFFNGLKSRTGDKNCP